VLADAIVSLAHNHPEYAVAMIARDAELASAPSSWGETVLQASSHLGHRNLLAHLSDIGVEFDLFAACAFGDRDLILSTWRVDSPRALGIHRLPVLHFGVVSRDVEVVEMLIHLGALLNPDDGSLSPLHSAVAIGSAPMVRCLLDAGALRTAVDGFGATPYDWACYVDDIDTDLQHCLGGR